MEELNERISAICYSPVLSYTRHKTYRQISLIFLVYLFNFYFILYAANDSIYSFEPYKNEIENDKVENAYKGNEAGKKYLKNPDNLKYLQNTTESLKEVEILLKKLETSVKELAEAKPILDEDEHSILKAFAKIDGILSYVYDQMKNGKMQLMTINPIDSEEIILYNSLRVKFMTYMSLTNDLKKIIAEKLNSASKRNIK